MKRLLATLTLIALMAAPVSAFTIFNHGSSTIANIYITPSSYTQEGQDYLDGYLHPNSSWAWSGGEYGCIRDADVDLRYTDGTWSRNPHWNTCTTNMTVSN